MAPTCDSCRLHRRRRTISRCGAKFGAVILIAAVFFVLSVVYLQAHLLSASGDIGCRDTRLVVSDGSQRRPLRECSVWMILSAVISGEETPSASSASALNGELSDGYALFAGDNEAETNAAGGGGDVDTATATTESRRTSEGKSTDDAAVNAAVEQFSDHDDDGDYKADHHTGINSKEEDDDDGETVISQQDYKDKAVEQLRPTGGVVSEVRKGYVQHPAQALAAAGGVDTVHEEDDDTGDQDQDYQLVGKDGAAYVAAAGERFGRAPKPSQSGLQSSRNGQSKHKALINRAGDPQQHGMFSSRNKQSKLMGAYRALDRPAVFKKSVKTRAGLTDIIYGEMSHNGNKLWGGAGLEFSDLSKATLSKPPLRQKAEGILREEAKPYLTHQTQRYLDASTCEWTKPRSKKPQRPVVVTKKQVQGAVWKKSLCNRQKFEAKSRQYLLTAVLLVRVYAGDLARLGVQEVLTWLDYLQYAGVEHVLLYDAYHYANESLLAVTTSHRNKGFLTYIDWSPFANPYSILDTQVAAYQSGIDQYGCESHWQTAIDIDEYPFSPVDVNPGFLARYVSRARKGVSEEDYLSSWQGPDVETDEDKYLIDSDWSRSMFRKLDVPKGQVPVLEVTMQNYLHLGAPHPNNERHLFGRYWRRHSNQSNNLVKPIYRCDPSLLDAGVHHNSVKIAGASLIATASALRLNHYWGARLQKWGPDTPASLRKTVEDLALKPVLEAFRLCASQLQSGISDWTPPPVRLYPITKPPAIRKPPNRLGDQHSFYKPAMQPEMFYRHEQLMGNKHSRFQETANGHRQLYKPYQEDKGQSVLGKRDFYNHNRRRKSHLQGQQQPKESMKARQPIG